MQIANREIGPSHPPYVIAEASCNHGGSLDRALELIDAAKACGTDAIKFQAVEADTITIDCNRPEFTIKDGPWKGRKLYDLYTKTQTPFSWFPAIFERARKVGITTFASVFDRSSVDMLEQLGCPAYKIASFELVDLPLIRYAASTGKPMILSTGMASLDEISEAKRASSTTETIPLYCTSAYPAPVQGALSRMKQWGGNWWTAFGISDHTTGPEIPIAATALGACIIEKHFKLSRHPNTEDGPFSMSPVPFAKMVKAVRNVWAAMQPPTGPDPESSSRPLRRSLFAVTDIPEGSLFTSGNVRSIRPGHGLPPKHLEEVLGARAARNITRGEPLQWEMVRDPPQAGSHLPHQQASLDRTGLSWP